MSHPFSDAAFRRDPGQPRDLHSRIDVQLTERIEEAVDFVCLDALVESRRARHLAHPVADSAEDRAEFEAGVRAFLEHLERSLLPLLPSDQRRHFPGDAEPRSERARLAMQVALAKALPDYWQRFDELRRSYTAETIASPSSPARSDPAEQSGDPSSGGERRSRLRRLFGGG
jgi:hypothetical protein